ncbi:2OG-Fe(II) oxygenase [Niveomyces insectorum RCEF 264]|uniref:2OG-Fe(II) oxygenase n=1 Tax=Niveomyces insectorum RCEF 264 TaxID=1081102 RepID=A0A167T855_9HYPO|nr:2OG-Fe(II) oxygenase [Niveomyces insectorum RCEF 264]
MSASHTFSKIPELDLSWADDGIKKRLLLQQLRHALTDVGFLYVVNHGVPNAVISDMVELLPVLFALPANEKEKIALHNSPHFLGYSATGSETTAGKADWREQVEFATEHSDEWTADQPLYERLRGPNQWPPALPSLRPAVEAYIEALTRLSERFLGLVAEALLLSQTTFLPFLSDQHRLKLVHYPEVPASDVGGQGVGPHKDSSGWWTFLLQASPPHVRGLQVLNRNGVWVDVPVLAGSFVVNIGQAFEVVTNGLCPATTHRVLAGAQKRFSVPFFQGVRRTLTKAEAIGTLQDHFRDLERDGKTAEVSEASQIDSPFLRGKYDTWGESQLRTKIRSHRDVGKRFYGEVFNEYINDEG